MKLLAALALVLALCTSAYGIKCHVCVSKDSCTTKDCGSLGNRCFTSDVLGVETKGCLMSEACISPIKCCEGDLCNSAPVTLPPVLLLGLTAFITMYLNQD